MNEPIFRTTFGQMPAQGLDLRADQPAAPADEADGMRGFSPEVRELAVDVINKPTKLVILAAVPGADREDIDLLIDKDLLKVKVTPRVPMVVDAADTVLVEENQFTESFRPVLLPQGLDTKKITAKLERGILVIEIPKSDEMRLRRISIG